LALVTVLEIAHLMLEAQPELHKDKA